MASFYSDHFTDAGNEVSRAGSDSTVVPAPGIEGGIIRYKRASISNLLQIAVPGRMCSFNSGDRILEAYLTTDGKFTAGTVDIGVYTGTAVHAGGLLDVNTFADALVVSSITDRIDIMSDAGADIDENVVDEPYPRGTTLWELVALGTPSYTVDPMIDMDIVITPTVSLTGTAGILTIEFYYVAADGR